MQTVSVTIDRFVEKKFETLLNEYGYEFSKHYDCPSEESLGETWPETEGKVYRSCLPQRKNLT